MRDAPLSILAIFAHPDDEIGVGGSLSRYSDAGVLTTLVTASRGEAATIYCDDCATRENLADVRTHELECACRNLGIGELRWLDWPDGGIADLPRGDALRQITAIIRQTQPDIIISHPENGLYPHPDHLAIWEMARAAFDAAGDPARFRNSGAPWSPARLFTRAMPQSFFDAAPAFASYRVQLNGQQLPFYATPDEAVDVHMDTAAWAARRAAAWECHRSQINPEGAFSGLSDELRRANTENEYFVMAAGRVPLPEGGRHDLLAGLDAWTSEPAATEDPAAVLRAALAVRRAYMQIYEDYARITREPDLQSLARALPDDEQEFMSPLARALRRADIPTGNIEPDTRLIAQALSCRSERGRVMFLLAAARHSLSVYRSRSETAEDAEMAALWQELAELAQNRVALLGEFSQAF